MIAQQILTINKAKRINAEKFHFEGTYMKLNVNANAFITMNPGTSPSTSIRRAIQFRIQKGLLMHLVPGA